MNIKTICIVILRILGIYCLIEAFVSMQGLIYALTFPAEFRSEISKMVIASLVPSTLLFIFGILLIVFSKKLGSLIIPTIEVEQTDGASSLADIQAILFSVAGVLIFSFAIPKAFGWISQMVTLTATDSQYYSYTPKQIRDNWISLTLSSIQMLIGIGLFFGANKLSLIWSKMRKWGVEK
ncbi:MAG: hypothetical protein WC209_02270 [Ignavibacteriaceae bacterium]|jgi:hypothetical protein